MVEGNTNPHEPPCFRPRFTVRRMMVAVAVVGLALAAWLKLVPYWDLSRQYQERVEFFQLSARGQVGRIECYGNMIALRRTEPNFDPFFSLEVMQEQVETGRIWLEYYRGLTAKYRPCPPLPLASKSSPTRPTRMVAKLTTLDAKRPSIVAKPGRCETSFAAKLRPFLTPATSRGFLLRRYTTCQPSQCIPSNTFLRHVTTGNRGRARGEIERSSGNSRAVRAEPPMQIVLGIKTLSAVTISAVALFSTAGSRRFGNLVAGSNEPWVVAIR